MILMAPRSCRTVDKKRASIELEEVPANPKGEGSTEQLGGKDAEDSREEAEEKRSGGLEENGVGQAESESEGVDRHVQRDGPYSQPIRQFTKHLQQSVLVPSVQLCQFPSNPNYAHHQSYRPPSLPHFSFFLCLFSLCLSHTSVTPYGLRH